MKDNRNVGLDLIKIFACLGVVALHTLSPAKGILNRWVALLATMSVPLFFMVSGYLMMQRPKLDWRYALKKILTILAVCFCWEFLHAAAHFLYYREVRNFIQSYFLDFFQQGLFYHFWYMGALILVYMAMPLIHKLHKSDFAGYKKVMLSLCVVNVVTVTIQILLKNQFILQIPQNLRCWIWFCYIFLGGYFAGKHGLSKKRLLIAAIVVVLLPSWLWWIGKNVFGRIAIEGLYGDIFVQLSAAVVFSCVVSMRIPSRYSKYISYMSSLTMGIYITHPFILAVLVKFIPEFNQAGAVLNLLFWLTTTVICAMITAIIHKVPVINRLTKL